MKNVLFCGLLFFSQAAYPISIKGKISCRNKQEELIGATVVINGTTVGTTSGLDGSYSLKDVPAGDYILRCSFMGFEEQTVAIRVTGKENVLHLDFDLKENAITLGAAVIVGTAEKSSDYSSRESERISDQVINVISSRSIELSPDINVASVAQRISGVTLEKNGNSGGQYAVLRGMDKRYNYSLVNGIKIPSPDPKHRYVPLDIFPSELLDRLEVSKSLSAEMEGDASGGVIHMIMKDAPPHFSAQAHASIGYSALFMGRDFASFAHRQLTPISPREQYGKDYQATMNDFSLGSSCLRYSPPPPSSTLGFSIGNRTPNKRWGAIVAGSYQNLYKGSDGLLFSDEMLQTEKSVRLTDRSQRQYSDRNTSYGLHLKADYKFHPLHQLGWYNAFISSRNIQVRETEKTNYKLNYDPAQGNSDLSYTYRQRLTQQQLLSSSLQGKHQLSGLQADWSLTYALATHERPDNTTIKLDNIRLQHVDHIKAEEATRRWEHHQDQDYSIYLHLSHQNRALAADMQLKAGGMYRSKTRANSMVSYRFVPEQGLPVLGVDFDEINEIKWRVSTPKGSVGPLNYDAKERIAASYIQAKFDYPWGNVLAGVRYEYTLQEYLMAFPNANESPEGEQIYGDFLPSVQIKYCPLPQMNLRASYFKSINRPGFFEIVPYTIINEDYQEYGNKDLKRAQIHNVDVRWEWFIKNSEQIMLGFFFKDIHNPIEYSYFTKNYRQYGYGPCNLGNAMNYGLEVDFTKYIRCFGLRGNYTYTHSAITTPKSYYGTDDLGNYKRFEQKQTRPLVNQAAHVANLSLLFKEAKYGWNAQLSAGYTGDKIVIVSHYLDSDYWEEGALQIDLSIEKQFGHGISLFVKANNLLNAVSRTYIKTTNPANASYENQNISSGKTLISEEKTGASILLGIRFKRQPKF